MLQTNKVNLSFVASRLTWRDAFQRPLCSPPRWEPVCGCLTHFGVPTHLPENEPGRFWSEGRALRLLSKMKATHHDDTSTQQRFVLSARRVGFALHRGGSPSPKPR